MTSDKNNRLNAFDTVRIYHKEMVADYRKAYPEDLRSNEEILECIRIVKKDERYRTIMVHWAVSQGGFTEAELFKGRLNKGVRNDRS